MNVCISKRDFKEKRGNFEFLAFLKWVTLGFTNRRLVVAIVVHFRQHTVTRCCSCRVRTRRHATWAHPTVGWPVWPSFCMPYIYPCKRPAFWDTRPWFAHCTSLNLTLSTQADPFRSSFALLDFSSDSSVIRIRLTQYAFAPQIALSVWSEHFRSIAKLDAIFEATSNPFGEIQIQFILRSDASEHPLDWRLRVSATQWRYFFRFGTFYSLLRLPSNPVSTGRVREISKNPFPWNCAQECPFLFKDAFFLCAQSFLSPCPRSSLSSFGLQAQSLSNASLLWPDSAVF